MLPLVLAPSARRAAVLDAVAEQVHSHTDAFYVVDLQEVVRKHAQWAAELPRVRPFFAVKCNDDARIVNVLAQLGCGFDCASKGEISMVLGQGVAPTDIIFAHPAKQVRVRGGSGSWGVCRMRPPSPSPNPPSPPPSSRPTCTTRRPRGCTG